MIDAAVGFVRSIGIEAIPPWEPQVALVCARLATGITPGGVDVLRQRIVYGHGFDRDQALMSALGEAVERCCGSMVEGRGPEAGTAPVIPLERLPRWSREEIGKLDERYSREAETDRIAWFPVVRLTTGRCFRAPAQMIFCPYHPKDGEALFWEPTTTGLAAHRTSSSARFNALLEVIERDALAVTWILRIPGAELSLPDVLGEEYASVSQAVLRGGLRMRAALVSLDIPVPVCVVALYHESSEPHVSFGSSAAIDVREACKKAIREAALVRYTLALRLASSGPDVKSHPDSAAPSTFQEHGLAWATREASPETEWLFGDRRVDVPDLGCAGADSDTRLRAVVGLVEQQEYPVFFAALETVELAEGDWYVARALVPGLQPLNPGRYRRMLDSERLARIGRWRGACHRPPKPNPAIHPFC